jgi:hypothetical protein
MIKPDSMPYTNTQEDYEWLSIAVTQARWQGVIPFEAFSDNRADPPSIYRPEIKTALNYGWVSSGLDIDLSSDDVLPSVYLDLQAPKQRYLLAIFGEKSSLGSELRPVAMRYGADLYLATGELSVRQAYLMARDAAKDGRELVLFTVADFDPSGHQMTVSIAREAAGAQGPQISEVRISGGAGRTDTRAVRERACRHHDPRPRGGPGVILAEENGHGPGVRLRK